MLFKLDMFRKLSTPKQPITRILVFHGIDTIGQTHYNSRFVSVHYFEKLLLELQKKVIKQAIQFIIRHTIINPFQVYPTIA